MPSIDLIKAVAVTAELCGRTFTEAAAEVFVADLAAYPEASVLHALSRCRKEVRGVLTTQDVISRIDDGRPGVEQAWAMIPTDENGSVVWTTEMAEAYGLCAGILSTGDRIGARMAFKEAYTKLVSQARDAAKPAEWVPSLGADLEARRRVLTDAVRAGLIAHEVAEESFPLLAAPSLLSLPSPPGCKELADRVKRDLADIAERKRTLEEGTDPLAWAKDLRTRDQGGETLSEFQRAAWRNALGNAPVAGAPSGWFNPIPVDALPPGMRAAYASKELS
jgi:hypothetical protein